MASYRYLFTMKMTRSSKAHNKTLLAQAVPAGTAYYVVCPKAGQYGASEVGLRLKAEARPRSILIHVLC
jgi:hypothetical protein